MICKGKYLNISWITHAKMTKPHSDRKYFVQHEMQKLAEICRDVLLVGALTNNNV